MKLGFKRGQKGFTLIELMIVMAIMAVMAAIVVPSVTGTTTVGRKTAQPTDIREVQTAVSRFNADDRDGSPWPTNASLTGVTTDWNAGTLPTGSGPTGSGNSTSPYVFTQNDIAGINFTSPATTDAGSKVFYTDYVRNLPKYASTSISVSANSTSNNFTIRQGGNDVYINLSNTTSGNLTFSAWGVDKSGGVWVFKNAADY
ncbi:MAG: Type secretion system protein [Dehalococcoidales bacterium]|nr:Type secretion system protein [Dehalococcoidales bacterium]